MKKLLPLAVCLVVLVIECALVWLVYQNSVTVGWAVVGHVIVVLALSFRVFLCVRAHSDLLAPMLLTITTAVLGLIGALGSLCVLILLSPFRTMAPCFSYGPIPPPMLPWLWLSTPYPVAHHSIAPPAVFTQSSLVLSPELTSKS